MWPKVSPGTETRGKNLRKNKTKKPYMNIQGVPKKLIQVFDSFWSKVGVTDFPENFTSGTPLAKGSEVRMSFNLSAQNGR